MREKLGYTIIISELFQVDVNKSREPIFKIDVAEIDVKKLLFYILENSEILKDIEDG